MVSGRGQRRVKLLAGAVAAALALMAGDGRAQVFDPSSPAVRDAYAGPVTSAKTQAALTGLNTTILTTQSIFSFGSSFSADFMCACGGNFTFNIVPVIPVFGSTLLLAGTDADLGTPGAPVDLTLKRLQAQASFTTARDFTVNLSTINTDAFDITLNGIVTANGALAKEGTGVLSLNGPNIWNGNQIYLFGGTLQGNAASLGTGITVPVLPATVRFDQNVDGTYSSQITGAATIVKSGAGRLTVNAASSISREVRVEEGVLALSGAGTFGSSATGLTVQAGATLDISAADGSRQFGALNGGGSVVLGANTLRSKAVPFTNTTFSGAISGTGGFEWLGGGTLTLASPQFYSGTTTVSGNTLRLEGAGRLNPSSPLVVGPSAIFDISAADGTREVGSLQGTISSSINLGANTLVAGANNADTTFSGSVVGTGGFTKAGIGTLTFNGSNAYTGTTTIAAGTLNTRAGNISETTVNHAVLAFARNKETAGTNYFESDTDVYSGTISGSGRVVKEGDGALWLRGINTYTGGTTVSNGALIGNTASLQGNIANNATLAFYQVTDGTYSGNLGGTGKLFVYGPGLVTMTGNGAADFTGVGGRLHVTGSLASNVAVAPGAEFGGPGTITGNVVNAGRLTRGTAGMGPININGNVAFVPGSTLAVKADAAGNSDRLVLSNGGAAAITGGTVDVQAQAGAYALQTPYTIVQAPGGVTGQFSSVTSNLAFLSPLLTYDPGNVYLTLTRNDVPFTAIIATANQSEAALAFMRIAQAGNSEDSALVLNTLVGLSSAQARAAFDSIAGAGRAAMSQTGVFNQRAINQNIVARLGVSEGGNAPATGIASSPLQIAFDESLRNDSAPAYAQALPSPASPADRTDASKGFWVRGYGGKGRLDGDANAAGADFRFGGVLAGFDHAFHGGMTLGVFGGYAEPRSDQDGAVGSARTRNHQLGTYGRYRDGAWYLDGIASYARQDTDATRLVVVGPLVRTASGSFNGYSWAAHVETGYTLASGITPMAALSWLRQSQDAYDEQGAGALNLSVPSQRSESLRSMLGARAVHTFHATGAQWTVEGRAAWAHEFNDPVAASARLAGDPSAAIFSVTGPAVPRDSAVIGTGISTELKRDLRFYADVNAELNGQQRTYALGAGLRYQW